MQLHIDVQGQVKGREGDRGQRQRISKGSREDRTMQVLTAAPLGVERGDRDSTREAKALVRRFWEEAWGEGKLDVVDQVQAPDHVLHPLWHNPSLGGSNDQSGTEVTKRVISLWRAALADFYATIDDQFAEGDKVVTRHRSGGTHTGEFMGLPPTGRVGEIGGITVNRIIGGKIVESWSSWDGAGLLRGLGVLPPMGPGQKSPPEAAGLRARRLHDGSIPGQEAERRLSREAPAVTRDERDVPTSEQNKAIFRYFYEEAWNKGNLDIVYEVIAPDLVEHLAVPNPAPGPEGAKQGISRMRAAVPDLRMTLNDLIAEGDKLAAVWTATGTHQGELMGMARTGRPVTVKGITIARFAAGKIAEIWDSFDVLGLLAQAGAIPPMGRRGGSDPARDVPVSSAPAGDRERVG